MSLALDEFYRSIRAVGVSSVTGAGMDEFFDAIGAGATEYDRVYRPFLAARLTARQDKAAADERQKVEAAVREARQQGGAGKAAAGVSGSSTGQTIILSQRKRPEADDDEDDDDEDGSGYNDPSRPTEDPEDELDEDEQEDSDYDGMTLSRLRGELGVFVSIADLSWFFVNGGIFPYLRRGRGQASVRRADAVSEIQRGRRRR
jgi:hypothetical protein